MTTHLYKKIARVKQVKYDKIVIELQNKVKEIEMTSEKIKRLEEELKDLAASFPQRKKDVYDECMGQQVNRRDLEKIGYKIMVLEHEMSAHRLKIKSEKEFLKKLEDQRESLEQSKRAMSKVLEKYMILIEASVKDEVKAAQYKEDLEFEEFSKKTRQSG